MAVINPRKPLSLLDEGVSQGIVNSLDFTGTSVAATVTGDAGLITITGGSGGGTVRQVEIDFGPVPIAEAEFTITDGDVTSSSKIVANVAYDAPTGKDLDELEMDCIDIKPQAGTTGQFVLRVKGLEGYLADKFKINYALGAPAGGSGGAPTGVQYVTLATDPTLTNERVLAQLSLAPDATPDIQVEDLGAGLNVNLRSRGHNLRRTFFYHDDYVSGAIAADIIGVPGGATANASIANTMGTFQLSSGAGIGSGGFTPFGTRVIEFAETLTFISRIRLDQLTSCRVFIGVSNNITPTDAPPPATDSHMGFLFDSALGINWFYRSSDGTTASNIDSGIAATTSLVTLRLTRNASSIDFQIDNASVGNKTTNLPVLTTQGFALYIIVASVAVDKTMVADYHALWRTGMSR